MDTYDQKGQVPMKFDEADLLGNKRDQFLIVVRSLDKRTIFHLLLPHITMNNNHIFNGNIYLS